MRRSLSLTCATLGRFLLLSSGGERSGPEEQTELYLLRDDFRDVIFRVPWPRWLWPWRRWWINAQQERFLRRFFPKHMRWYDTYKNIVEADVETAEARR